MRRGVSARTARRQWPAMKPRRRYRKISDEQKALVKTLTVAGMTQKNIAKEVGIPGSSVCLIRKSFGLGVHNTEPLLPATIKEILDLRRAKHGAPSIARILKVPMHRVQQVFAAYPARAETGKITRYFLTAGEKQQIRRRFRKFEEEIARELHVSLVWMRRFLRRRAP